MLTEKEKPAGQDWRGVLPGILVSILALAIIFYFVPIRDLLVSLSRANYFLVATGVITSVVWLLVRALFWRTLLKNRAPYRDTFLTIGEGYLLNNFLPFRLGEVGRSFLLSQKAGLSFWEVFSTILIERALDVSMAAVLFLSAIPFVVGARENSRAALLMGAVMVCGLAGLYLLARYRDWALRTFEKVSARLPMLQRLGGSILPTFLSGLGVLTEGWLFLRAIFWLLLNWAIAVFQYYVLMAAFFPHPSFLAVIFCLGAAAFGIAAPSSPGNLGVFEGAIVLALSLLGLDKTTAFAFALTTHLIGYIVNGLIGAYALSKEGQTLAGLYGKVRNISRKKEKELQPPVE